MDDYDPIEVFAGLVGGIVRDGAVLQGPAKEKELLREEHARELLKLRRQMVVIWRDALAMDPSFSAQADCTTYELLQEYKQYTISKCPRCNRRAPLQLSEDFSRGHNPLRGARCAWGCDLEEVTDVEASEEQVQKTCLACEHCYCEPDDDFVCGHQDSGPMGLYVKRGPVAHCGNFTKFKQHPLRNADGSLKTVKSW